MKKFHNILSGINYQPFCPSCKSHMRINGPESNVVLNYGQDLLANLNTITFEWENESIELEVESGSVCNITQRSNMNTMYAIGNANPIFSSHGAPPGIPNSGIFMCRLRRTCNECSMYSYTLQIVIDMERKMVGAVFLNTESISFENTDISGIHKVCEIKNLYGTKKTVYTIFEIESGKDKILELPLIPLNLQNPEETLSRIKNLVIFS